MTAGRLVGGRDAERANAAAVDSDRRVHLAGRTGSGAFPLVGPALAQHGGDLDAFLARVG